MFFKIILSKLKKIFIGITLIVLGIIAWKSYFFAGTGYAFIICAAIVIGGILVLFSKNDE